MVYRQCLLTLSPSSLLHPKTTHTISEILKCLIPLPTPLQNHSAADAASGRFPLPHCLAPWSPSSSPKSGKTLTFLPCQPSHLVCLTLIITWTHFSPCQPRLQQFFFVGKRWQPYHLVCLTLIITWTHFSPCQPRLQQFFLWVKDGSPTTGLPNTDHYLDSLFSMSA